MNRLKLRLFQLGLFIMLIAALEFISKLVLSWEEKDFPYFINTLPEFGSSFSGYDFDPLLGWSLKKEVLESTGFTVKKRILQLGKGNSSGITILITGGSTTDLVMNKENWPVQLFNLFEERKLNATIYVASVGGYNSGQELLRLIRDGIELKPDIHISYSGANESNWPDYSSAEANQVYENTLRSFGSIIIPNTVFLIRSGFSSLFTDQTILYKPYNKSNKSYQAYEFWIKNMKIMKGISEAYGYRFYGILQPVLGMTYDQPHQPFIHHPGILDNLNNYCEFYPNAMKLVPNEECLYDFTNIFDNETGYVFSDECHLAQTYYQVCVAERVFELLDNSSNNFDLKTKRVD